MVVLDTDHLTILQYLGSAGTEILRSRLDALENDEVATTIANYEEQTRGWMSFMAQCGTQHKLVEGYRRLQRQLQRFCKMQVLDFDERAAVEFSRLQAMRLRIGTMDLRIAAIALSNDALLLSRNLSDFKRIPELDVEDWTTI
jgi:tRNA(fMet)-specific endonuclease VapC